MRSSGASRTARCPGTSGEPAPAVAALRLIPAEHAGVLAQQLGDDGVGVPAVRVGRVAVVSRAHVVHLERVVPLHASQVAGRAEHAAGTQAGPGVLLSEPGHLGIRPLPRPRSAPPSLANRLLPAPVRAWERVAASAPPDGPAPPSGAPPSAPKGDCPRRFTCTGLRFLLPLRGFFGFGPSYPVPRWPMCSAMCRAMSSMSSSDMSSSRLVRALGGQFDQRGGLVLGHAGQLDDGGGLALRIAQSAGQLDYCLAQRAEG